MIKSLYNFSKSHKLKLKQLNDKLKSLKAKRDGEQYKADFHWQMNEVSFAQTHIENVEKLTQEISTIESKIKQFKDECML